MGLRVAIACAFACLGMTASAAERPSLPTLGDVSEATPYDPDPAHPWNRLHAALFRQDLRTRAAPCLVAASARRGDPCLLVAPRAFFREETVSVSLREGGDTSTLLLRGDAGVLAEPARRRRVAAALEAALRTRAPTVEAAVLLQHDLWERFDALNGASELTDDDAERHALGDLRDQVGRAIRALALPEEVLLGIRPNLSEVARAHADLLPGLETGRGWVEVLVHRLGSEAFSASTTHAAGAGYRSAFAVLVRPPEREGGADWLRRALERSTDMIELPPGSRAALLEVPLAVSHEGKPVGVPLVTLDEMRRVLPAGKRPARLEDLTFEVLEGRRGLLGRSDRPSGGLERLGPTHPVPDGASCVRARSLVLPLRAACLRCHDAAGARLPGLGRHGTTRLTAVKPGSPIPIETSIAMKLRQDSFRRLRALFAHWDRASGA